MAGAAFFLRPRAGSETIGALLFLQGYRRAEFSTG